MQKETRDKKEEIKKEIIVLDEGIDMNDMAGPRSICCRAAVWLFRG